MKLLDGRKLSLIQKAKLQKRVAKLRRRNIVPGLGVIMVGNNPASEIYVKNKRIFCEEIGVNFQLKRFASAISQMMILKQIDKWNSDKEIHGIIVQLPLPTKFLVNRIVARVNPKKDVDGLHPDNFKLLAKGKARFIPPTCRGIIELLKYYKIPIKNKKIAVIGRGKLVGKPLEIILKHMGVKVTAADEFTKDLSKITLPADIVITATGQANLIIGDMLKAGVTVVDAGTSKVNGKLVGDSDWKSIQTKAKYATPVPGGVGPLTVSSLIANVIDAAEAK